MSDTPARRRPPAYYVDRAELAALVRDYRRTRKPSNELAAAFQMIAGGVWDRYHFTADRDDFVQDVLLHLLDRPLKKADPKQNLFGYFTTCVMRFGMKLRDKANGDRRRFEAYAAGLVASGVELPSAEPEEE